MDRHRLRQRVEIVAAFEHGDDAAVAVLRGDPAQLLRRPHEVRLDEAQAAQRIAPVGVEARRNHDQVRAEVVQGRQDA